MLSLKAGYQKVSLSFLPQMLHFWLTSNKGMTFYAYLLLSESGKTYAGQTNNLRRRLKEHSSPQNKGYTRGQKWYLLTAWSFESRDEALIFEKGFKYSKLRHRIIENLPRTRVLIQRYEITLN